MLVFVLKLLRSEKELYVAIHDSHNSIAEFIT